MPKTKICKYVEELNKPVIPEFNPLEDLFRRYMRAYKITGKQLAEKMNCTPANVSKKLQRPARLWSIGEIEQMCLLVHCNREDALEALKKAWK